MLSSLAARAINGKGASTSPNSILKARGYAVLAPSSSHHLQTARRKIAYQRSAISINTTLSITARRCASSKSPKDQRWTPDKNIKFSKDTSDAKPEKPVQAADFTPIQPEFEANTNSQKDKATDTEQAPNEEFFQSEEGGSKSTQESTAEQPIPEQPAGPLPDLRQGIPSTFAQEYSDVSSSFKSKDSEPPSLNITEDPAEGGDGGKRGEGGSPREQYISSIERRRDAAFRYAVIGAATAALLGGMYFGRNWDTEEEARLHPELPDNWNPVTAYGRAKVRVSKQLGYYTEPTFPKLLPNMGNMSMPFTLVLSLEDLLISSKWNRQSGWEVAKRPGVDYFLRYLSQYFELVVFTSVQSQNADLVLKKLDPYHFIMFPLYREATRYKNGEHVKDLSYLNRDLSKTLIIDTNSAHTQFQPENAIILPKWSGQKSDPHTNDLIALIPFLEYLATMAGGGASGADVRKVLQSYAGTHIPTEFHAREERARQAFQARLAEERAKRGRAGAVSSGLSSLLGIKPGGGYTAPGEQTFAEALREGKMMSDQVRERGQRTYEYIEKDIRENGAKWLEEEAKQEKKMQEEATKSMQANIPGFFGSIVGGAPRNEEESEKK